jgi:hypothetical protein
MAGSCRGEGDGTEKVYCTCNECIKLPQFRLVSKSTKSRHIVHHGQTPLKICMAKSSSQQSKAPLTRSELAKESCSEQAPLLEAWPSDFNAEADNPRESSDKMELDVPAAEIDQGQEADFRGDYPLDKAGIAQQNSPDQDAVEDDVFEVDEGFDNEQDNMFVGGDHEKGRPNVRFTLPRIQAILTLAHGHLQLQVCVRLRLDKDLPARCFRVQPNLTVSTQLQAPKPSALFHVR